MRMRFAARRIEPPALDPALRFLYYGPLGGFPKPNMIDVHSHLIWGVDDGSHSLTESIEMAELAALHGTSVIVATPHSNHEFAYDVELIQERLMALRRALGARIEVLRGCDMHLTYENVTQALQNPQKYTINSKNHLLVEFSDASILPSSGELFQRMLDQGIVPVITHPERNLLLQDRLKDLEKWVMQGCALQITGQSLLGGFGRRAKQFAEALVRKGLAHIVASDGHDMKWRPPRLDEAYQHVREKFGEKTAQRLFIANPQLVISGGDLSFEESGAEAGGESKPGGWRRFWKRG